ncbi:hypothetical protein [Pacificibacter sp. AS14]|uniref:hypothetical protein n=1 Tax=Pacificibacter sp. AS14 TaxID=3135785 RepID=UPI003182074C
MTMSITSASMGMMTSLQSQSSTSAQATETERSQTSGPPAGGPPPSGTEGAGGPPPPNGPPPGGNKETSDADLASLFDSLVSEETDEDSEDETLTGSSESSAEAGYSAALSLLSA